MAISASVLRFEDDGMLVVSSSERQEFDPSPGHEPAIWAR